MTAWCWALKGDKTNTFILAPFCGPSFALRPISQVSGYRTPPHRGPPVWHSTDEGVNQMANSEAQHQVAFGAKGLPACAAWCSYSEILNNTQRPCPTPNFHTTPSDVRRWAANALHRACLPGSHARGAWERSALLVARLMPTIDCCMFQADACIRGRSVRWPVAAVNSPPGKPTTSGRQTNVSAGRGQNSGYE